jgi:hypothetical protein
MVSHRARRGHGAHTPNVIPCRCTPPAWNLRGLAIGLSLARTGHAEGTEPTPHLQRHSMPHPQRHSMPVYSTGVESPWACHRIVISAHRGRTHPNVIPCRCTPPAWNLRRIANGTTKKGFLDRCHFFCAGVTAVYLNLAKKHCLDRCHFFCADVTAVYLNLAKKHCLDRCHFFCAGVTAVYLNLAKKHCLDRHHFFCAGVTAVYLNLAKKHCLDRHHFFCAGVTAVYLNLAKKDFLDRCHFFCAGVTAVYLNLAKKDFLDRRYRAVQVYEMQYHSY